MAINKGIMLILLTALISGFSIFLNAFAVNGFDSSVFTFAKNIIVAVLLFSIIIAVKEFEYIKRLTKKQWTQLVAIGFVGGSVPFLLFFKGLQMTSGTTSGFIHKTMFVFVALLAIILLKEKLNKWLIASMFLLLAGTFIMIRPDFNFSIGHLLVLGAVLFWAFENILAKKALADLSGNIVAFGRMFFGSIFIFIFLLFAGKFNMIFTMNGQQYLWILITSILLLLYVITYYNGLKYVSATTATAILVLGQPITTIISWAYGSSALNVYDAFGIILIMLGAIILLWYSTLAKFASRLKSDSYG